MFNASAKAALLSTPGMGIIMMIGPLLTMIPLYCYRHSHPLNLVLLAIFTFALSGSVGVVCTMYTNEIVLEALVLTATVVCSLTLYTFWAVKKGRDFDFLGPMLFAGLMLMLVSGLIQMIFPLSGGGRFIYALLGAALFSGYIVFDTHELIQRHSIDEYVWASVGLYLDIINLFLRLLEILQYVQGGGRD